MTMKLGKRLKSLRKARNLSQADLEKKTGIKREYLSKMETDDLKNPTLNTMTKPAKGLGFADAAIFLTSDPQVLAAIVSATCKAQAEAETARQFQELCGPGGEGGESVGRDGEGEMSNPSASYILCGNTQTEIISLSDEWGSYNLCVTDCAGKIKSEVLRKDWPIWKSIFKAKLEQAGFL